MQVIKDLSASSQQSSKVPAVNLLNLALQQPAALQQLKLLQQVALPLCLALRSWTALHPRDIQQAEPCHKTRQ